MEDSTNYTFSLADNNLVAETSWFGDLTHEIITTGVVRQNQWILENSYKLPLILVSDYTKASLDNVTDNDLQQIADQFHGENDLFPDMTCANPDITPTTPPANPSLRARAFLGPNASCSESMCSVVYPGTTISKGLKDNFTF